jgi:hypothetical protein
MPSSSNTTKQYNPTKPNINYKLYTISTRKKNTIYDYHQQPNRTKPNIVTTQLSIELKTKKLFNIQNESEEPNKTAE